MNRLVLVGFSLLFNIVLFGQSLLNNASFEGTPQDATVPTGWHPCERGTTPDILPGVFNVYQDASEGDTFMGLITREDGSFESVGQRLRVPIHANECYKFSLDLAHSRTYAGYNAPVRLRMWGGTTKCSREQLLAETGLVKHLDWRTYKFQFFTKKTYNYIIIEAYYGSEAGGSYKGNILLDSCSKIEQCTRA